MSKIAGAAQTGFAKADAYDRFRPSYPEESIDNLLENLGIRGVEGATVLDLAAGTGKFTSILANRPEKYQILAIEPHDDMRKVLEGKGLDRVKVITGMADKMPAVESNWAQAVVVAQTTGIPLVGDSIPGPCILSRAYLNRFAHTDALQEIHRVLQPRGTLGLIWNLEDYNSRQDAEPTTKWEGKLKDIIWANGDVSPRFRHNEWPKVFDEQVKTNPLSINAPDPLFSLPLGEHEVKWTNWMTKDTLWSRFHTISHISVLQGPQLEEVKKTAFEAMDSDDVEHNDNGEIAVHGCTLSYWTTAIPSEPIKRLD